MRSADLNNIIVNHAPNHHSKNPGWEYFPSSQIKCQVEAAQKKELAKPTPPSIKIKTLNLKANYVSQVKPKHVFKKTDIKELGKQKREALQNWIQDESNLKKGIQKPHKCKPAPPPQEEQPNDQWPEEKQEEQQDNNNQEDEEQEQDENNENDQMDQSKIKSIDNENEQDEKEINNEEENQSVNDINEDEQQEQSENSNQSQLKQKKSSLSKPGESQNNSLKQSVAQNQSKIIENKSEVQSQISNSFVQQKQTQINKSMNTSSLIGYKSQMADQMRSLLGDFE